MTVPILISTRDERYSEKLAQWVLLHPETGFHPVQGQIQGEANSLSNQIPMIRLSDGASDCAERVRFILLVDHSMQTRTEDDFEKALCVDMYQPMPALFSDIRRIAVAQGWMAVPRDRKKHPRLTLVVQLAGASYRQPIGPALSAHWSKKVQTLYLGMDPAGNTDAWFPASEGSGLSRLAYHLQSPGQKLDPDCFLSCLGRETTTGIHFLRQAEVPQDAARLTKQSLEAICEIASECGFEEIICDAGVGLAGRNLAWMELADICCLVCSTDMPALLQAEASARLLSVPQTVQPVRETAAYHWMFVGETGSAPLPVLADRHMRHLLPDAYSASYPLTGWAMQPAFIEKLTRIASMMKR